MGAALDFLERSCEWELPRARPAFAQGMVAGLPLKLWFEPERVLLIAAGLVVSAAGGHVTTLASTAGVRLPIRTHPLQAFVTNHYAPGFDQMVASSALLFYISRTARGEMLIGAEIDRQPSYSYQSGHHFLQSCSFRALTLMMPVACRMAANACGPLDGMATPWARKP